jgi:hypothetical protein
MRQAPNLKPDIKYRGFPFHRNKMVIFHYSQKRRNSLFYNYNYKKKMNESLSGKSALTPKKGGGEGGVGEGIFWVILGHFWGVQGKTSR